MTRRGYMRVSTDDQSVDLQRDALETAGVDQLYVDHGISGTVTCRPQLDQLLADLEPGDTLMVWRLDRLGRTVTQLSDLLVTLQEQDIEFCSVTEGIDTNTTGGKLVFHIFAAIAEFERDLITDRINAGIAAARARGQVFGRPRALSNDQCRIAAKMIEDGKSVSRTAREFKVSRCTLRQSIDRLEVAA